jgi:Lon protease-like protein
VERLPLFLLHTVLFPGAHLPLKVFEARYLDMVSDCLKHERPFGVCLIKSGHEVGDAGEPHRVGTLAHIERWEMPSPGILHILVRGGERFAIRTQATEQQLVLADVELWTPEPYLEIPADYANLSEFLREVLARESVARAAADYTDASWVGLRLAELLPVDNALKQEWLALRDPLARLAAILEALKQLAHRAN